MLDAFLVLIYGLPFIPKWTRTTTSHLDSHSQLGFAQFRTRMTWPLTKSIQSPTRFTLISDKGHAFFHCRWLGECLTMLQNSTLPLLEIYFQCQGCLRSTYTSSMTQSWTTHVCLVLLIIVQALRSIDYHSPSHNKVGLASPLGDSKSHKMSSDIMLWCLYDYF